MTSNRQRPDSRGERWTAHPKAAWVLRLAIRLSPVGAAALLSWQLSIALRATASHHRWTVFFGIAAASLLLAIVVERLARRLLPLTTLLALTMLFPDRAPTRWKVARRAARPQAIDAPDEDLTGASVSLLAALTSHDRKTRGHSERVRLFADMLGQELRLSRADADRLRWAALLHDVGKIDVEAALLNKPGLPTPAEWRQLRAHPLSGARLAGPLLPWLGEWGSGIVEHHERFDGSGYPQGLGAMDISRAGRALAVVDAYEVMTAARSYKRPMSIAKARLELANSAGSHFDPAMVRAFLAISLPRLLWTTGPLAFLANLPFLTGLGSAARALPALATPTAAAAGVIAAAGVVAAVPANAAPTPNHPTAAGDTRATLVVSPSAGTPAATPTDAAAKVSTPRAAAVRPGASAPAAAPSADPQPSPSTAAATPAHAAAPATTPTAAAPGHAASAAPAPVAATPTPVRAAPPVVAPVVPPVVAPVTPPKPKPAPTVPSNQTVSFELTPKNGSLPSFEEFAFSSPDATAYAYSLDGGGWQYAFSSRPGQEIELGVASLPMSAAFGKHTLQVRVVSAAGAALGPTASYTWTAL